ncbi:MAG: hypothetical protein EAZ32_04250 [Cytophagia bacterium]|jgi:hypothetical protein|nr:MAG: hypothetical protein EAZ46_07515 [Runella sp.]TAG24763.1 MAG: hypothetical protein EAZ38_00740 [Cytophagales bacterium]TAG41187.1 MAG: hypothetical protein EAZ32_04250 [Cytophagia bacterium]TAG84261.1 MAG: hypothetical protein EAZ22_00905 [Cytophagales bacterium]
MALLPHSEQSEESKADAIRFFAALRMTKKRYARNDKNALCHSEQSEESKAAATRFFAALRMTKTLRSE